MASSAGKKSKKVKRKAVPLNEFLLETGTTTLPAAPVRKSTNWADEVENETDLFESKPKANFVLPTAPRAIACESDNNVPNQPPYVAYISNLTYDIDEQDLTEFFAGMQIVSMRLPRSESDGGRLKGFGYIEFENRENLIDAISIPDLILKGRRMRIEVATNSDSDRRRGGRMDMNRDRPERPEVTSGDWRSGPRTEPPPDSDRRGGGGGGGGFSRDRDRSDKEGGSEGAWRDSSNRPAREERSGGGGGGFTRGGDRDNDRGGGGFTRGGDRDNDRGGGFTRGGDRDADRGGFTRGGDRDSDRGGFTRGGDRDNDRGGRFGDRGGDRSGGGGGFGPRRNYGGDREGGGGERERSSRDITRGVSDREERGQDKSEPRMRPKLVLAPRTRPIEETAAAGGGEQESEDTTAASSVAPAAVAAPVAPVATPVPAASIFGKAKPVDTLARDLAIEEKIAKEREARLSRENSRTRTDNAEKEDEGKRETWRSRREDNSGSRDRQERRSSPDNKSASRNTGPKKNDDRRGPPARNDKNQRGSERGPQTRGRAEERPKENKNHDREKNLEDRMPKLKEQEPPNFTASNKYDVLEPEESG